MATNEILQFASQDTGSNLLTQTEYEGDAQRVIGHQPGIARSRLENKVLRQTSLMAAGLAQFMAANQSGDITDGLSAQDIADALNMSLENKIAAIGAGGITTLQCEAAYQNTYFDQSDFKGIALELTTGGGEVIIVGGFSYKQTSKSTFQIGNSTALTIGVRIIGSPLTTGNVTGLIMQHNTDEATTFYVPYISAQGATTNAYVQVGQITVAAKNASKKIYDCVGTFIAWA